MPFKARRPMGGFKIMYEYANRLYDLGYSVHITYPLKTRYMEYRLPYLIRKVLTYLEGFRTSRWFMFRNGITMSYVDAICDKEVMDSDVVIATWWSTALDMGKLNLSKGKKINLIQGYENWIGHIDELHSSYNMPDTTNIVVASYLQNIVNNYTTNLTYLIPNAIDSDKFQITNPIKDRNPYSVCMMYSVQEIKGSQYGLDALYGLKTKYPQLQVDLFGICSEPEGLPEWIRFYRDPEDIAGLFNRNSIFIANSLTEGMALTPMEAMFCGCACVLTDIEGHSEYGIDNNTALLYQPKNTNELMGKLEIILSNDDLRLSIAVKGNEYIQQFSWNIAVDKMDEIVKGLLN